MSDHTRAWVQIHFCVLLWGFTAILGKLITMPALPLVLWRMLMVAGVLFLLPRVWRGLSLLPARLLLAYMGIGVVVALHWLTFYGAIKLANASVAATCIATVPVFLAFIEPLLTGSRFSWRELLLGILILPGIILLVGGTPESMNIGIAVGILSAFFVAIFSALNKRLVHRSDSLSVTALEMGAGGLFLAGLAVLAVMLESGPVIESFITDLDSVFALPGTQDLVLLLVLAFGCTLLPFALSLVALRHLSAFATSLAVNLEPVYAIVLAIILLNEQQDLNLQFYSGAALLLLVVFIYPLLQRMSTSARNSRKTIAREL
jgi:drug/metabolite transporter (DMT)-like permease